MPPGSGNTCHRGWPTTFSSSSTMSSSNRAASTTESVRRSGGHPLTSTSHSCPVVSFLPPLRTPAFYHEPLPSCALENGGARPWYAPGPHVTEGSRAPLPPSPSNEGRSRRSQHPAAAHHGRGGPAAALAARTARGRARVRSWQHGARRLVQGGDGTAHGHHGPLPRGAPARARGRAGAAGRSEAPPVPAGEGNAGG